MNTCYTYMYIDIVVEVQYFIVILTFLCFYVLNVGAMHFVYYINRLAITIIDTTYVCLLTNRAYCMSYGGLERRTIGSVAKRYALSHHISRHLLFRRCDMQLKFNREAAY